MKIIKITVIIMLLFAAGVSNAQVGIGTNNPNRSAQLDVNSTCKGFLPPRMTEMQRNAIQSPVAGLLIWCNNCGASGELQVFNGACWTNAIGGAASHAPSLEVAIGTQVWMNKNLDVLTYRNGDTIPQVTDISQLSAVVTGAWCYYNNDPALGVVYGKLYNWKAITDPRGLAPLNWNIPTIEDWSKLELFLGGTSLAEDKMKEAGTSHWVAPNTGVTNESKFSALPAGYLNRYGFGGIGDSTIWWSSSILSTDYVRHSEFIQTFALDSIKDNLNSYDLLYYNAGPGGQYIYSPVDYFSVRCIKD